MMKNMMGKVWNFPNTVMGLAYGAMGLLAAPHRCKVRVGHNAVEFCGHPWMKRAEGVTLGNVIAYKEVNPPEFIARHEEAHTRQGEVLGPLYLPLHAIALIFWHRMDNYRQNPLERGPYSDPPRPL